MKKLLKILAVLFVIFVVLVFIAGMFIGPIIKKGVETVGPQVTKVPITLESASLSLLGGSGSLGGLFVGNPEGYKTESAVKVGKVSLGVDPMSLTKDKVHVKSIRLQAAEVTLESHAGMGFAKDNNLTQIQKNIEAFTGAAAVPATNAPAAPADKGAAKKLQVDEILLEGVKVKLALDIPGIGQATLSIPTIHLTNLGQGPDGITPAGVAKEVSDALLTEVLKVVSNSLGDLTKNAGKALESLGKDGGKSLEGATKGIGDLFKKKK
ncbi:MAG: AsmA family protein [Verrucomicrobia bacterium]|nr:AsmA family protein [Verrucomicrobiota bacterium]